MGLIDWWKGRSAPLEDSRLRTWRAAWDKAASTGDTRQIAQLAAELDAFGLPDDDVEIEREMLEAFRDREALSAAVRAGGLPLVETGHRAVRGEPCHYSAPASMPDEPGQPGGRLLLTSSRAVFVGGPNGLAAAWHSISRAMHIDRDLVLTRNGRDRVYRFRCNAYGDALRAAFIADELLRPRQGIRDKG